MSKKELLEYSVIVIVCTLIAIYVVRTVPYDKLMSFFPELPIPSSMEPGLPR